VNIAFWPGLGGDAETLCEIAPVLDARGYPATVIDPGYGQRDDWSLGTIASDLAASGAEIYAGHSWGGAVAVEAAAIRAPRALVLLDGGHVGQPDFVVFGESPDPEIALQEARSQHDECRWPSWQAYVDWVRGQMPRWSDELETAARSGMKVVEGEIFPPFDGAELERILRGYHAYDPTRSLAHLPDSIAVLLVVAHGDEFDEARARFVDRFRKLVPNADVEQVESGHDVVWGVGPPLGDLIADWLSRRLRE
jgi:pimeloyl-ACP methyl ester carboxylesterase